MSTQEYSNEGGIRSFDGSISPDISHDELSHLVMELSLQNEYLKEHFKGLQAQFRSSDATDREYESSEEEKRLRENVRSLNREIQEQREMQRAAEDAMVHLRASHSEADSKIQELSAELIKAQQKMEQEIKERDDKYVELDSKFGRLLKRAKQRIQELQKILVGEKEAQIAELDAASTGEAVRLGAAVEAAKGELAHLKQEHEKEKESWDAAYHTLCKKLEASESACLRAEIEAAKLRNPTH
ncbi:Protein GRIP [Acorus calamus]|uniref:Protein GRIP n=1 Tax=Acorus calamus TaxID=4465 RepID=A0AAV9FHZ6_ACOCL|nr:Protein GRIP [Acorus calamus]